MGAAYATYHDSVRHAGPLSGGILVIYNPPHVMNSGWTLITAMSPSEGNPSLSFCGVHTGCIYMGRDRGMMDVGKRGLHPDLLGEMYFFQMYIFQSFCMFLTLEV